MDERTAKRFKSKVRVQSNGCWHLSGRVRTDGYADFTVSGRHQLGHRVSYEHHVGPIPDGLQLDHLCHTADRECAGGFGCLHRRCVNPAHLEPVTHQENALRGRSISAENHTKTVCARGHEFTEENTYRSPTGSRGCRICRTATSRAWMDKHNPGTRHGDETHCPQHHPYEGENLIITSNGGRACRECKRAWGREYMRAKRARLREAAAS
jgi:hypothetical protein